ncbi:MAG TPA: hypothetical protein PK299_00825 [Anaerolineales bacterium]|nr:hypothetical protein [Anaerolineales bacterium]
MPAPILISAFKRTRTLAFLQLTLYILLAVGIVLAQSYVQTTSSGTLYLCITAVFLLGGLMCILQIIRFGVQAWQNWRPTESRLLGILKTDPQQVAWLYQTEFPIHVLFFEVARLPKVMAYLRNGLSIDIHTSRADQAGVLAELRRLAPDAVLGYSQEQMVTYRKDPANFGKN